MQTSASNVRWFGRLALLGLVVTLLVGAAGWYVATRTSLVRTNFVQARSTVCADFGDAVGVYVGNTVSLMGVPVGTVQRIEPRPGGVRMSLSVDDGIALPADVGAVVIDNSIVTDRRVEFSAPYTGGPSLNRTSCIPQSRTKTPRGVSENFTVTDRLLTDALGADAESTPGKPRTDDLAQIGTVADRVVSQRGADFSTLMRSLVQMAGDAPETDAVLRRLLENSNLLTAQANRSWPDIRTTIETVNASLKAFTAFSEEFTVTLERATHFVPIYGRFFGNYGVRIVALLKYFGPWVNTLAPYATRIGDILARLPGLATVTDQLFDSKTGALRVMWKPPVVDLRGQDTARICAAVAKPPNCIVDSSSVGLVQLIMGGGR
ncbi:phospholipid/cholesterol/gamma-HCH transport system substrate-binding protein [Tsukamurella ocularis]|nr:phospholipid/cholesterol/gamma-HCH transport system substrate-binding protein [Tsukamurella ocularis]